MGFKTLGAINDVVGNIDSNITDRTQPQMNPGEFLKDWVTTKLPDHVVNLAIAVAGRDDGSGTLAKSTLEAGQDKNLFGGIFQGK